MPVHKVPGLDFFQETIIRINIVKVWVEVLFLSVQEKLCTHYLQSLELHKPQSECILAGSFVFRNWRENQNNVCAIISAFASGKPVLELMKCCNQISVSAAEVDQKTWEWFSLFKCRRRLYVDDHRAGQANHLTHPWVYGACARNHSRKLAYKRAWGQRVNREFYIEVLQHVTYATLCADIALRSIASAVGSFNVIISLYISVKINDFFWRNTIFLCFHIPHTQLILLCGIFSSHICIKHSPIPCRIA